MIKQSIHIINLGELFSILEEIKSSLSFEIFNHGSQKLFIDFLKKEEISLENSLILTKKNVTEFKVQEELIDKRQILELSKLPITLPKLIENINVNLIKQKYNFQSNIIIKNYTLNINSRTFFNEKKELRLTQREIDIILFLNQTNKSKNIITLQNEVWKHESKLDTHTVETHIYRLRKKIKEVFDDDNFIKSRNDGYSIQ
jgi:hypothetical protein